MPRHDAPRLPRLLRPRPGPAAARGGFLSPITISTMVREAASKAGLRKEVWTHLFRHTRATQLLKDGMPLVEVSEFLGHDDVNTTRKYYHQDSGRLGDAYDAAMAKSEGQGGRRRRPARHATSQKR